MLLLFCLVAALSFTLLLLPKHAKFASFHPPPGPKGLPLIGNLHHFDFSAPHTFLANLAKTYGPVLTLSFGCKPVVVVQSAKTAKEVLQTQDLNFCNRAQTLGMQKLSYNGLDIAFSPYNDYFREVKKISVVHLLSSKRVQSYAPIRHQEISRLLRKVSNLSSASEVVNLSELVMSSACSNICRIAFGKRYDDEDGPRSRFQSLLNEAQAMFITFFYTDYFPFLWFLDKLNGQYSRLERVFKALDEFYDEIINDHLEPNRSKSDQQDIIDVLLHLQKEHSFAFDLSFNHIKGLLMNIFVAGTDTSAATVVWAMTELVRSPTAMKKVQEEIRIATRNRGFVVEEDLENLEYFKAVVKEVFRLHPASPLLVPHETIHKSNIEGYDILAGTIVYVNAYAIGRDPVSWKDPEAFMPERFLGSSTDFKGHHFELIPFGAGRRICPGLHLGLANTEVMLSNLLYSFDWELPAIVKDVDIDMDILPGITMHKKNPLCLTAKRYPGLS